MSREVQYRPAALRDLNRLPKDLRQRLWDRVDALAEDPFGPGTKPLQGNLRGLRCVRVGDWRISYQPDDPNILYVIEVSNRRDAYKRLGRDW